MIDRERTLLEACYAVVELSRRGGRVPEDADRDLLSRTIRAGTITWRGGVQETATGEVMYRDALLSPDLTDEEVTALGRIMGASFKGFFDAAADGLPLTRVSAVVEWNGLTVQRAYPGAGRAFTNLATTYWTLNALVRDGYSAHDAQVAVMVLYRIGRVVGPLFFPSGVDAGGPRHASRELRKVLSAYGRRLAADELLGGGSAPSRPASMT